MDIEKFMTNVLYKPFGEIEIAPAWNIRAVFNSKKFRGRFFWSGDTKIVYPEKYSGDEESIMENCIFFRQNNQNNITEIYSDTLKDNTLTILPNYSTDEELYSIYEKIIQELVYKEKEYKEIQRTRIIGKTIEESGSINKDMMKTICYLLQDIGFPIKKYTEGIKDNFFEEKLYILFEVKKRLNKKKVLTHIIELSDTYLGVRLTNSYVCIIPIPKEIIDYDFYSLYLKKSFEIMRLL